MGRVGAFLQVDRAEHGVRPAVEAVGDFDELVVPRTLDEQCEQASRCMNCGVAFCQSGVALGGSAHVVGCPLHNLIPETNDLLYRRRFDDAIARVALTNPFPEFTGRVCPAPCEMACNLGLHQAPVTINDNERALSDLAWECGMDPLPAPEADAPLASVVGSGPAGLAVAWELARRGWRVRVYERSDRPGGLLTYGIPNMKLPKWVVERRVDLMRASGIEFACGIDAREHAETISDASQVVVIATGAPIARDVVLPGRELDGIHFALDYLGEVTAALLDGRESAITARGKNVVVIGGGDTGTDCVACALRQGAASVRQVIRAPRPPQTCDVQAVWPAERVVYTQGYGQREASELLGDDPRAFSTDTIAFEGTGAVEGVRVQELSHEGTRHLVEGSETTIPAQLVLIAKGFTGADERVFEAFGVDSTAMEGTPHCLRAAGDGSPAIYVAGDARMGSTLVVSAMADALACADEIAHALVA